MRAAEAPPRLIGFESDKKRGNQNRGVSVLIGMGHPQHIPRLISLLRGKRVMLDRDLAGLYGVTTGNLNKAVRRNSSRFPPDFMFQLTVEEQRSLRFQTGILKRGEHSKYPPLAFTEQGVAMLSSVLRSAHAIAVNVAIMRAFVRIREVVSSDKNLEKRLAELERLVSIHGAELGNHARLIQEGFEAVRGLMETPAPPRKRIGFDRDA